VSGSLTVDIHFDLICPWCFIGKRHFDLARVRLAQEHPAVGLKAVWHSVQLLPDVPEQGLPFAEFYERRLGSPEAVRRRQQQVESSARRVGIELDLTRIQRVPNTTRAHHLLRQVAELGEPELYEALLERLFVAYFVCGEDIGDAATLWALAAGGGVPMDRLGDAMPGGAGRVWPDSAVPGVPHFVFNRRLSVSGAYDVATLFEAMCQGGVETIAVERARP
jgi:predicted DsbA family dithiol-disulfide isomerase